MMSAKFAFSPQQRDAIFSRGENLLVAAGAGSGKTTVLVERILRYIENGGSIEQVLALTFTGEAAADMREKLDRAISILIAEHPQDQHLQEQLILLPQARISTIHSFCLDLVRRNYYRIGLEAGFRVAAEAEIRLLEREVLLQYLEEAYADSDSGIAALADAYGGNRDDSQLVDIVLELHRFCRSRPQPLLWLQNACAVFSQQELAGYPFAADMIRRIQRELGAAAELYQHALAIADDEKTSQLLAEEAAMLRTALNTKQPEQLLQAVADISFGRLPGSRGNTNPLREQLKKQREQAKNIVRALQQKYTATPIAEQLAQLKQLQPLMAALYRLTEGFENALAAEKQRRCCIDFSDMEHLALSLLEDEEFSAELRANYQEILIDEYQDINEIQEAILQCICRGDNLFAVGDVKQSIYRFRLAEPQLFLHKYNEYGSAIGGRRIDLNYNYRSETAVIDGVNFIFRQLMREDTAEIEYDTAAELHTEKTAASPAPEFWLIDLQSSDSEQADDSNNAAAEEDDAPPAGLEAEARLIVKRIGELHQEGYSYGDMAILLRASRNREPVMVAALAEQGIPAVAEGCQGYLETAEISLILSVLRVIDNPRQDIALAAVLRSPFADFTPDELVEIRFAAKDGDLYQALRAAAETEDANELSGKCAAFLQRLAQWRSHAAALNVSELINYLYRENGYYQLVGAMSDGVLRQANLRLLLQEAYNYERNGYAGLFRFIRYLDQIQEQQLRSASAVFPGGREDAVRIMSIHRSKGLEFPVVFVAGLGGRFNFSSERGDIIWERDAGLGPMIADRISRRKYPSLAHTAVAGRLHELSLAEEIRIYYVAFTRAKQRLILTAAARNMLARLSKCAEAIESSSDRMSSHTVLSADSPLTWLATALLRHPAAEQWRQLAATGQDIVLPATADWRLEYLSSQDLPPINEAKTVLFTPPQAAEQVEQRIAEALAYRYPFAAVTEAPAKWTVTALARMAAADEFSALPDYAAPTKDGGLAAEQAALRGTAYHALLEKIDLAAADSVAAVQRLMAELVAAGRLSNEQSQLIDVAKVADFLLSPLGQRLRCSPQVVREQEFTFLAEATAGEHVLVQGMLDAAFRERSSWVLLDYKTGGYGKSDQDLRDMYAPQLTYYAQAAERLLHTEISEIWLVMLDLRRVIRVDL